MPVIKGVVNEEVILYMAVSCLPGLFMLNNASRAEFSVLFAACICIRLSLQMQRDSVSNQSKYLRDYTFSLHLTVQRTQLEI